MSKIRRKVTDRPQPTAVDVIMVAGVPALIIAMICSLLFFLVLAFYQGGYDIRLMYLLGMFTLGTVMIGRLAADNGRAYANAFSVPLAIASALAMLRFVQVTGPLAAFGPVINWGLLGVAWFLADRITLDCTVFDERERSQQQGLLQSLGLLNKEHVLVSAPTVAGPRDGKRKRAKTHNPGIWVMYFALMALPLFGLGQITMAGSEHIGLAFTFLVCYLGSALSLLVVTSFLSMRRYVRQQGLEMPADMSRNWIGAAILGVFALLAVCQILPLPGRNFGLVSLPFAFDSPDGLEASRGGWGEEGVQPDRDAAEPSDDAAKTPDERGPQTGGPDADAKGNPQASDSGEKQVASKDGSKAKSDPQSQDGDTGEAESEQDNSEGDSDDADQGGERAEQNETEENNESAESGAKDGAEPGKSPRQSRSPANWMPKFPAVIGQIVKWATIAVLAGIVLVYFIMNPGELSKILRAISEFLARLFGARDVAKSEGTALTASKAVLPKAARPFRDYQNPFAQPGRWPPEKVVSHTFLALQAWSAERGVPRGDESTAVEFARNIAGRLPELGAQCQPAAEMVDRLLFANWHPTERDVAKLESLWAAMGAGTANR